MAAQTGSVSISDRLFGDPDSHSLRPHTFAGWVRLVCWMNRYGRDADWVIPSAGMRMFFTKRDIADLTAIGWLERVERGYAAPMRDPRGDELWSPGPERTSARKGIPAADRAFIYQRDGHRCVTCGTDRNLSIDHIHPVSKGGTNDISNLQTMCLPCNSRKGARV